ncbi:MAG TPA: hypothetical protein VLA53_05955 [Nitrosopumilaceae archaeon]|nr:hypothetical protein [Nitrosopumilaceae archaeon]
MSDYEHDSQIEKIALLILDDKTSLDEQNPMKLQRYYDFVKTNFKITGESAEQLVNESFLYLKLKNTDSIDPLQDGDKFGAGFS